MIAFGYDELDKLPEMDSRKTIDCPHCGKRHPKKYGQEKVIDPVTKEERWEESTLLTFYDCTKTGKSYLYGIGNKIV